MDETISTYQCQVTQISPFTKDFVEIEIETEKAQAMFQVDNLLFTSLFTF